jgi:apolipoprotein N-acyltransferase
MSQKLARRQNTGSSARIQPLAGAFLLGACMPFSFSPYDYKLAAIVALAGWVYLIWRGPAWWIGFAFGLGWFGVGAWWLAPTFHTYGPIVWPLAVAVVVLVGAVLALFPALIAWATRALCRRERDLLLVFPCVIVLEEWLRGWLLTGLPWTSLGNLLLDTPAVGWAAYAGVYGIAALPATMAASIFLLTRRATRASGAVGAAICFVAVLFSPAPFKADGGTSSAALVQANIAQDVKWDSAFLLETMQRYQRASAAATADVLVWPEAAVPMFLSMAPDWDRWLSRQVRAWKTPLIFGGIQREADSSIAHNGIFLEQPGATQRKFVGKQHLVPFGEYVPAWLPFVRSLAPGIGDWQPSFDDGILSDGSRRYGSLVCYEAIFPEIAVARVRAGAEVLVNVTNDTWYGESPAAWQHLQAARMRAVETGRFILRAANSGITAIIAPDGSITQSAPWFTESIVQGEFNTSGITTPYVRWGNAILFVFALPLAILGISRWLRARS